MRPWIRTVISACDHCGLCCLTPCLLGSVKDVDKLANHEGLSRQEMLQKLQVEVTPSGRFLVRIKPVDEGCPYHIDNQCTVHKAKPRGGREFKCWDAPTRALTYFWNKKNLRAIGFEA